MSSQTYTMDQVAQHASKDSCWIVIDNNVYDVTKFLNLHPGSDVALLQVGGTDATEDFYGLHRADVLERWHSKLAIGTVQPRESRSTNAVNLQPSIPFPFEEARSQHQTEQHMRFRMAVREILTKELKPLVEQDTQELPSTQLLQRLGQSGYFASILGPGPHLKLLQSGPKPAIPLPGGVLSHDFSIWHELICQEEIARLGSLAVKDAVVGGLVVGLPPVLNYGSESIIEQVALPVLRGENQICLAITEPYAGSDVSNIRTTATKSECGRYYVVTGTKKWITQGLNADWFCTLVRTGSKMSLLVIPRSEQVITSRIKTSYSPAAGTSFVVFNQAKVPVEYLLGKEGEGFQNALSNFTHERWAMLVAWNRMSRLVVNDCVRWAHVRKAFGNRRLVDQPVIQDKLARMIGQVEATQHWIEDVTYRISTYASYNSWSKELAGEIALLKLHQTRVATMISDQATQILGGRGLTKTGMGSNVERFMRTYKFGSVTGGSEEIMASYGVRQILKDVAQFGGLPRM